MFGDGGEGQERVEKIQRVGVIQGQTDDPSANKKGLWWQRDGKRIRRATGEEGMGRDGKGSTVEGNRVEFV